MKEQFFRTLGVFFMSLFTLYTIGSGIYLAITQVNPWGYCMLICIVMTIIGFGLTIKYDTLNVPEDNAEF